MDKNYLIDLLTSKELVVQVVKDFAELEWNLDIILTRYFTAQERYDEFFDIIVGSLTFNQKMEIFTKMTLPKRWVSRDKAVHSLKKLRKLRNLLAHSFEITSDDIHTIASDNELSRILTDYPKSYNREIINTKNRLHIIVTSYIKKYWKKNRLTRRSS
jgi:hypothetical protein